MGRHDQRTTWLTLKKGNMPRQPPDRIGIVPCANASAGLPDHLSFSTGDHTSTPRPQRREMPRFSRPVAYLRERSFRGGRWICGSDDTKRRSHAAANDGIYRILPRSEPSCIYTHAETAEAEIILAKIAVLATTISRHAMYVPCEVITSNGRLYCSDYLPIPYAIPLYAAGQDYLWQNYTGLRTHT